MNLKSRIFLKQSKPIFALLVIDLLYIIAITTMYVNPVALAIISAAMIGMTVFSSGLWIKILQHEFKKIAKHTGVEDFE